MLAMPDTKLPLSVAATSTITDGASSKEPVDTAHVELSVEDCPDGGLRAWLVVLGVCFVCVIGRRLSLSLHCQVFCGLCATVGLVNAWGVSPFAMVAGGQTA